MHKKHDTWREPPDGTVRGSLCRAGEEFRIFIFNHLLLKDYGLAFCTYKPDAAQKAIAYTDLLDAGAMLYCVKYF